MTIQDPRQCRFCVHFMTETDIELVNYNCDAGHFPSREDRNQYPELAPACTDFGLNQRPGSRWSQLQAITGGLASQPSPVICDGCNVRSPHEHRCHGDDAWVCGRATGQPCQCPPCAEAKSFVASLHVP